jgi:hypothetical protein
LRAASALPRRIGLAGFFRPARRLGPAGFFRIAPHFRLTGFFRPARRLGPPRLFLPPTLFRLALLLRLPLGLGQPGLAFRFLGGGPPPRLFGQPFPSFQDGGFIPDLGGHEIMFNRLGVRHIRNVQTQEQERTRQNMHRQRDDRGHEIMMRCLKAREHGACSPTMWRQVRRCRG